jgi:hypothetical protein
MTRVTSQAARNHAVSMARYRRKVRAPLLVALPAEPNPVACEPFRVQAADVVQRLQCARRRECLNVASLRNWPAWTCEHCGVRELAEVVRPLRQYFDGALPVDTSQR